MFGFFFQKSFFQLIQIQLLMHSFPFEVAAFSPIIVVHVVRLDIPPGGLWYIPHIALCISVYGAHTKFGRHSQTSQFSGCNWKFVHSNIAFSI